MSPRNASILVVGAIALAAVLFQACRQDAETILGVSGYTLNAPAAILVVYVLTFILSLTVFIPLVGRFERIESRAVFWFFVGILVYSTFEFWILGPYSFVSFADEGDQALPFFRFLARLPDTGTFLHQVAGGVDRHHLAAEEGPGLRPAFRGQPVISIGNFHDAPCR